MPTINLDPYVFFPGTCKEAMEFYKSIFGGEVTYMMIDDLPAEHQAPGMSGKVMHADLKGGAISFMASDGTRTTPYTEKPITLSISGTDKEQITSFFNQLAEGGHVDSPLKTESWDDIFGSLTDKFNVDWMVNIGAK